MGRVRLRCERCGGTGRAGDELCSACNYQGYLAATADDLPDRGTTLAILAWHEAKAGTWPVTGGWMDQVRTCVEAVQEVRAAVAACSKR